MPNKKIVVVLGRKAFGRIFPQQQEAVKLAASAIADLVEEKYEIVITHSNAPQIGMIHSAMTEFSRLDSKYTVAPMSICSAMSQGYIGYDLQNAIRTELVNRGIYKPVTTLITQVRVNPFDAAFSNPTKVIGRLMTEAEAKAEEKKGNHVVKEGDGYRRIIAAPKPVEIYEKDAILALLNAGQIVIAAGGGGIPVLQQGASLKGASAIIEKDYIGEKLAETVDADTLLFLTGVDKVYLNFGEPGEIGLDEVTPSQAANYIEEGHFAPNSMLPKVEAGITFAQMGNEKKAIVAPIEKALAAVKGKIGTVIKQ